MAIVSALSDPAYSVKDDNKVIEWITDVLWIHCGEWSCWLNQVLSISFIRVEKFTKQRARCRLFFRIEIRQIRNLSIFLCVIIRFYRVTVRFYKVLVRFDIVIVKFCRIIVRFCRVFYRLRSGCLGSNKWRWDWSDCYIYRTLTVQ